MEKIRDIVWRSGLGVITQMDGKMVKVLAYFSILEKKKHFGTVFGHSLTLFGTIRAIAEKRSGQQC